MNRTSTRRLSFVALALLLACGLAFAATTWARPATPAPPLALLGADLPALEALGDGPLGARIAEHVATRLELTDTQRQEIHDLVAAHGDEIIQGLRKIKDRRVVLFDAIHQHPPVEGDITAAAGELSEAQTELALLRADLADEVHQVLTPEQQAELEQMRQNLLTIVDIVTEGIADRLAARLAA